MEKENGWDDHIAERGRKEFLKTLEACIVLAPDVVLKTETLRHGILACLQLAIVMAEIENVDKKSVKDLFNMLIDSFDEMKERTGQSDKLYEMFGVKRDG